MNKTIEERAKELYPDPQNEEIGPYNNQDIASIERAAYIRGLSEREEWKREVDRLRQLLHDASYSIWKGSESDKHFAEWQDAWLVNNGIISYPKPPTP